jgi:hypothetical protein
MKLPEATTMAKIKTDVNFMMKRFQKLFANDRKCRMQIKANLCSCGMNDTLLRTKVYFIPSKGKNTLIIIQTFILASMTSLCNIRLPS